jgi:hypothetical protein
MNALTTVLRYEVWIFLLALAAVVAYQLLTGKINTRGLLRDKMNDRAFSPGRLQLLMTTLGGVFYYVLLIFANQTRGEFPPVPSTLVLILGGSHAFYLGGKLSALLGLKLGLSSPRKQ